MSTRAEQIYENVCVLRESVVYVLYQVFANVYVKDCR